MDSRRSLSAKAGGNDNIGTGKPDYFTKAVGSVMTPLTAEMAAVAGDT